MAYEHLGEPLTGGYTVPGGIARIFERGAVINNEGGEVIVTFTLPMIGVPHIAVGAAPLPLHAFTFQARDYDIATGGASIRYALAERLALLPTGEQPNPTPIAFGAPEIVADAAGGPHGVATTASLRERQLYDVAVRRDDGQWTALAPNALYYRSSWHDFGIAHITDIHLGRRIDYFPGSLVQLGQGDGAQRMYNWNDRFRGFIRYANYLHSVGALDVILATGDILDYLFEDDDDPAGGGNALFARELLLGRWPSEGFEDVGPLRVPIFMIPGNHDYRRNRYRLLFNLDVGLPFNVKQITNFAPYNLNWAEALALSRGDRGDEVPELSTATAAKMVEVDRENIAYTTHLADRRSYVVQLGDHRIVMLDSGPDKGIVTGKLEGILAAMGGAEEDERTFIGGSPNSEGLSDDELNLIAAALQETPDGALVIVGLHAPLFNPWAEAYPYYLRETQRPAQGHRIVPHLARHDPQPAVSDIVARIRSRHPSWFAPAGAPEPAYVKRGDNDDLFDYGVSRGKAVEALRLIAGIGTRRPADVVLHGHVHRFNEFRIGSIDGEPAYYMDFYSQNPARYYPSRFGTLVNGMVASDVTYVEVADRAPANADPTALPAEAKHKFVVRVPPYPKPLATAPDARAWWAEHRPLVLQSEAYGPLKDREVSYSGFRLLSIKGDVIDKIHFIPTQRLHDNGYRLPVEDAIRPEPARRYQHLERSREYNRAEAAGTPYGYLPPGGAMQNIIYRDSQGDLLELWRDGSGATGTGNLTRACNGPRAAGDPIVYIEPPTGTQVVLFRGVDGHLHSLYWAGGDVGYDHLTSLVSAPRAEGNPVGYHEAAAGVNHIIYRKADGNLHELWWSGQEPVGHGDLSRQPGAPKAIGDPAAFHVNGTNLVFYRATDGHIHSLYWSNGPTAHENVTGYARSPKAAGDPHGYYTAHNNASQLVYRGVDGHIHELWWVGIAAVNHLDASAAAAAPPAASDPVSFYSPNTNTKHVFYRATNGHLIELWWSPGGGIQPFVDLTAEAWAPAAVGKPSAFANGPYRHVVYRAADSHIHEIRFA